MSAAPPPPEFVTRTEAARLIGWYPQRVTAAVHRRDLPAYRVGNRILLKRTDVEAFAAEQTTPKPLDPKEDQ
ncbi:helix-turn-helix domain-containing protein [Tsukamurella sp. DT100]|uniref:helix-turn-helix domain-containing protein n=1 Tax=Tsukamurella sp. DT100 TaxID=3393415 RepID=UPI003CF6CE74